MCLSVLIYLGVGICSPEEIENIVVVAYLPVLGEHYNATKTMDSAERTNISSLTKRTMYEN